jgi:pimeloyl-ACP methyl ester carboxylesterase
MTRKAEDPHPGDASLSYIKAACPESLQVVGMAADPAGDTREVRIPPLGLVGTLQVPADAHAVVAFAHGSGSSRLSARNRAVADALNARGIATLLFDLLTLAEEIDRANVFDIPLLAGRLVDAVRWIDRTAPVAELPLGLFGASTGAAAALVAAARLPHRVGAVVSRGGRPDLAGDALDLVRAPTLLIVGGADVPVIGLNERAFARLRGAGGRDRPCRTLVRAPPRCCGPCKLVRPIIRLREMFHAFQGQD